MPQTTMTDDPSVGESGTLYYPGGDVVTRTSEGATAAGLAVIGGATEGSAKVPAAAFTTKFIGIVHCDDTELLTTFADKDSMGVVRRSLGVLVSYEPDTDPTIDTPVYARHTANGAGKLTLGAIRANADTANASLVPGGYFRKIFASEKKAVVELTGQI